MSTTAIATRGSQNGISPFTSSESFDAAIRMADCLADSNIVPKEYIGNPSNCLVAMEVASRLGVSVMTIMQSMTPIHGRPAFTASFLIATVNTCGRFGTLRYKFAGTRGTPEYGCSAIARDVATGEDMEGTFISMAMAQAEGWVTRAGSKWKTMPDQMLRYRAAAFWQRAYAPELSLGMQTIEELSDIPDFDPGEVQVNVATPPTAAAGVVASAMPTPAPAASETPAPAPARRGRPPKKQPEQVVIPAQEVPVSTAQEAAPATPAAEPPPAEQTPAEPKAPETEPAPTQEPAPAPPQTAPADPQGSMTSSELVELTLEKSAVAFRDFQDWLISSDHMPETAVNAMTDIKDLPERVAQRLVADKMKQLNKCVTLYAQR